jgi:hypothetical protein
MAPKERKPTRKTGSSGSSDGPKGPDRPQEPTLGNPDADPQRIHREYVERHFGGGEEPTSEAYERALEEWHRLPGAAQRPPAEIRGPEETEALIGRRAPASADDEVATPDFGPEDASTHGTEGSDEPRGGGS